MNLVDPLASPDSRRLFLRALLTGSGSLVAGLTFVRGGASQVSTRRIGPVAVYRGKPVYLFRLDAVRTDERFGDGSMVPFLRFRARPGQPTAGLLPRIDAPENAIAVVEIRNQLTLPILPGVRGIQAGSVIAPGTTGWLAFHMPRAGTWLLEEVGLQRAAGPAGFAGVVVSRPSAGGKRLWNGGPTYDREFVLLYQETDDRWNRDVVAGRLPNLGLYEPNFYTVDGLSYPALANHRDTRILCRKGERVLLRLGNLGHLRQSIHFHGYHADVAARNNVPERTLPPKDTVPVAPGGTTDVIVPITQSGKFPVHPHLVPAVTANGLYPYGQLALIEAL